MRIGETAVALAGLVLVSGPANAQDVDADDPASVLAAVQAFGHEARLETDEAGFPVVLASADDINYGIQFYGCKGTANCSQLQFAATFDLEPGLTADYVNARNEAWAIGRLSIDPKGDPLFTYFLTTDGGLSAENFRAVMRLWSDALAATVEEIGY